MEESFGVGGPGVTVIEELREQLKYVRRKWVRRNPEIDSIEACLIIRSLKPGEVLRDGTRVYHRRVLSTKACGVLAPVIRELFPEGWSRSGCNLTVWNDCHAPGQEAVEQVLEKAIVRLEETIDTEEETS